MDVAEVVWPEPAVLEANRERLLRRALEQIARVEQQFGLSSAELKQQLAVHAVEETPEIASWLLALETVRLLERER